MKSLYFKTTYKYFIKTLHPNNNLFEISLLIYQHFQVSTLYLDLNFVGDEKNLFHVTKIEHNSFIYYFTTNTYLFKIKLNVCKC